MAARKKQSKKSPPLVPKANVGLVPGPYAMAVSFRDQDDPGFERLLAQAQKMYRTRCYSQKEIAIALGISAGRVAKMVRCDPDAPLRGGEHV